MKIRTRRLVAAAAGATLALGGLSAAHAAGEHTIRQSDFVAAASDTRSSGAFGFGPKGLVIETKDNSSNAKVAEYFARSGSIPGEASYNWDGSTAQPGSQIVFDVNGISGDGNDYNVIVGEQVYSSGAPGAPLTDWWYTGGTARAAQRGFTCPSTTGGSGSDCHGTLAQWQQAVPAAKVGLVGFSLGSGVQGEGVLKSMSFDSDTYTFAAGAAPAPPAEDVTGSSTYTRSGPRATVTMTSDALPEGTPEGDKIDWVIKAGTQGKSLYTKLTDTQGAGEKLFWQYTFPTNYPTQVVEVYKNGVKVQAFLVRPGS